MRVIDLRDYSVKAMSRPKSKRRRIEIVSAILEVIVIHCLKVNTMWDSLSVSHWRQEIATHILQLKRVKLPSGRNIPYEDMESLVESEVSYSDVHIELELLKAQYNTELEATKGIDKLIRDLILDEYQNLLFDSDWTMKHIYRSPILARISRGTK